MRERPLSPARREGPTFLALYGVCWWIELDYVESDGVLEFTRRGDVAATDAPVRVYALDTSATLAADENDHCEPAFVAVSRALRGLGSRGTSVHACDGWIRKASRVVMQALEAIAREAVRDLLLAPGAVIEQRLVFGAAAPTVPFASAVFTGQSGTLAFLIVLARSASAGPGPICGACAECRFENAAPS